MGQAQAGSLPHTVASSVMGAEVSPRVPCLGPPMPATSRPALQPTQPSQLPCDLQPRPSTPRARYPGHKCCPAFLSTQTDPVTAPATSLPPSPPLPPSQLPHPFPEAPLSPAPPPASQTPGFPAS